MNREEIMSTHDLSGRNLMGCSLGGADLRGKVFRGADLSYAHLGGADLRGADFRNAQLFQANFGATDLRGADFRYADVRGVNFVAANTIGSDFRECIKDDDASFWETAIPNCQPAKLVESESFKQAKSEGFYPLSHWGRAYQIEGGPTLYRDENHWQLLKKRFSGLIFGDKKAFREVKLVQPYLHYSQWAYMLSRNGFERIAGHLGIKLKAKNETR